MSSEIILPMFYLMCLTVAVFLFSTSIRLKEIYFNKTAVGEEHRHPPFDKGSKLLKNTQRNLVNLFEFPILFYAVCICIYMTGNVDEYFITLAVLLTGLYQEKPSDEIIMISKVVCYTWKRRMW